MILDVIDLIKVADWLNKNAPQGKIAYSGFNFHYPLYGRDLAREVDYININECADCRYVDYKNSEQSIRRDPDFDAWIFNLKKKNKEYLVVDPVKIKTVPSYEFEWANKNPDIFKEVFYVKNIHVFKIFYDKKDI